MQYISISSGIYLVKPIANTAGYLKIYQCFFCHSHLPGILPDVLISEERFSMSRRLDKPE